MNTKIILGLLLVLLTAVGCDGIKSKKEDFKHYDKVLIEKQNGQIRDIEVMMDISKDTAELFRIGFAGTDSVPSIIYWVKLSAIEQAIADSNCRDHNRKFDGRFVGRKYVYKGTALQKNGDYFCATIITLTPLEDYIIGKKIPKSELTGMKNCIYFETNNAHVKLDYAIGFDYVYPQNNEK